MAVPGSGLKGKNAHHVEAEIFDEFHQLFVLGFGPRPGLPAMKGGADGHAGDVCAVYLRAFSISLRVTRRFITFSISSLMCCSGMSMYFTHARCIGDRVDHFIGETAGIRVHQSQPGNIGEFFVEGFSTGPKAPRP